MIKHRDGTNLYAFGVYCIMNNITGRYYLGSTTRTFGERLIEHYQDLKKGNHRNPHLQTDYNELGEAEFEFFVVEETEKEESVKEIEKYWLEYRRDDLKYNLVDIHRFWVDPEEDMLHGAVFSPTGDVYDVVNLARFCRKHCLREDGIRQVVKGDIEQSKGWSMVGSNYCGYHFVSPDGTLYNWIHNLDGFATKYNLVPSCLDALWLGHWKHWRGWRRGDTKTAWPALCSPEGVIHKNVWNIDAFAVRHGLLSANLTKVIHGKRNHCGGWTLHPFPLPIIERHVTVGYIPYKVGTGKKAREERKRCQPITV